MATLNSHMVRRNLLPEVSLKKVMDVCDHHSHALEDRISIVRALHGVVWEDLALTQSMGGMAKGWRWWSLAPPAPEG